MNITPAGNQNQIQISNELGTLDQYFSDFQVGTLLNRSGITKTKGASPLTVFKALFKLAFCKTNLYQGIVQNKDAKIDKDAAYNFLNSSKYNWQRFTLLLFRRIYFVIRNFLDDSSEEVLIFDDSIYSRNRSKKVELLSRVSFSPLVIKNMGGSHFYRLIYPSLRKKSLGCKASAGT